MSLTRSDKVAEITKREALADAYKRSAAVLREALQAEAIAELDREGTAPSWTIRDLGKAVLPVSVEKPYIADTDALVKWVKERHPEHVETREDVRAAFQTWLLQYAQPADDVVVDPESGEIIPGMAVRQGNLPGTLTITPDKAVKAQLREWAEREVARLLAAENGPVSDAD
ncbi:MAG TPA: hypothetical protein VHA75_12600 [Rugosimonospora sp.]|nr:hypothetical protein [Rugosimonospora sp.]